ncbi:hypothetical protein HN371_09820 [Candidatus Poribacteria bacterium]|jgi:hypothetical protein|nr:hypothetical protein [Candidatus Poribacteria bacterium]MBT5533565.1 hypothetical protein [Candidatus Poribacteria bacterium]
MRKHDTKRATPTPVRLSLRATALGALLIPLNCYWVTLCEIVWPTVHATVLSLFFNVVFSLFLVCLANLALGRWAPKHALRPGELLVVYAMLSVATSLFGHDMLQILFPLMNYAEQYATPENDWATLIHPHLPGWLTVSGAEAHRGYYDGQSSFFAPAILRAWAAPLGAWAAFVVTLYIVFLCINTLIRRQWTEHEKLSYPIAQIPGEMLQMQQSHLFRNRYMWWGFGLAAGLDVWNGIATLWPVVPFARFRWEIAPLLTARPWNGISWLPVRVYPFAIGLAYFMPLDLAFSTWFFYLYWKATEVMREAIGVARLSGAYLSDQSAGAWLGIGLYALWKARYALVRSFRAARSNVDTPEEPMNHRAAWLGLALGSAFLIGFMTRAGVPLWASAAFMAGYYTLSLSLTRMRAELGPPTHDLYYAGPERLLVSAVGTRPLGPRGLTGFSLFFWATRDYRCHPMPHQLESYKLAEAANASRRGLTVAMIVASVVGLLACYLVILPLFYHYGSASQVTGYSEHLAREAYVRLESWRTQPKPTDWPVMRQLGAGLGLTVGLMALRHRFLWFPFHPVGFAVAGSWTMSWMWFSVFISWGLKLAILRSGGIGLYRRLAPFFVGLVLGQYLAGGAWTIIGNALGRRVYGFFVG